MFNKELPINTINNYFYSNIFNKLGIYGHISENYYIEHYYVDYGPLFNMFTYNFYNEHIEIFNC